jgi:hypothetical protein
VFGAAVTELDWSAAHGRRAHWGSVCMRMCLLIGLMVWLLWIVRHAMLVHKAGSFRVAGAAVQQSS